MLKLTIRPYLADLQAREVSNREVARILDVSEEHISRTLKALNIVKVPSAHALKAKKKENYQELEKARKAHLSKLANTLSPQEAAEAGNCHIRTIYRHKS